MKYILASKSPRRHELLKKVISTFEIDVSNKEEKIPKNSFPSNVPVAIAKQKAIDVSNRHLDSIIIGADTVVIVKNQILGKPKDKDDVERMIRLLSNRSHKVVTGVCIIENGKTHTFKSITKVFFRKLSESEIDKYCKLDTIYDKAGAYAIQAEAGEYIYKIKGEYDNVVGLPTKKLKNKLKRYGLI